MANALHPPGRRRLRSAVREDGHETWTIGEDPYDVRRACILDTLEALDVGDGVLLKDLIGVAEVQLAGHPLFRSGRFTHWIRFVKVDLECEGVVARVGPQPPQRRQVSDGH